MRIGTATLRTTLDVQNKYPKLKWKNKWQGIEEMSVVICQYSLNISVLHLELGDFTALIDPRYFSNVM
jgi:hypothetical protein